MTEEERRKAVEEMTNSIVNNMTLSEVMAIVVEKARVIAERKIDGGHNLIHGDNFNNNDNSLLKKIKNKLSWIGLKEKKIFSKKHKGFNTRS